MYTENTGSNKPSDVLDLLKMVYEKKVSIIACDAMGMYQQIWRAFGKKATHAAYDWTVKADADAVLSLGKHVEPAHLLPVPATGAFLINCEV